MNVEKVFFILVVVVFFFCCEEVYYEGVVYWLDDVYENGMNDVEEGC